MTAPDADRKRRGAWFTPDHLVAAVVDNVVDEDFVRSRAGRPVRILDPACGDGRFLIAAIDAVESHGGVAEAVGVDIDAATAERLDDLGGIDVVCDDALTSSWLGGRAGTFDLVLGNPPYLSQLSATTTRGGASGLGGGPYADAAVEFLALGAELVDADRGRLAFVLPQSILSSRDAHDVRASVDARATMIWSAWTGARDFDAQVVTCALAFEFSRRPETRTADESDPATWTRVVTERTGVPALPALFAASPAGPDGRVGRVGDRVRLNANFRDEYYGMIGAVGDHHDGPPLITSGLIDPGRCRWGERPVRFAKRRFEAPRIDRGALDAKMTEWARRRLVPKVLVANQTSIIEAVCDPSGAWLPGVPVVAAYPLDAADPVRVAWELAAVLCAPSVSVWAWHRRAGSGLSPTTIRVGPTLLAELPWPQGTLDSAVDALRAGDVEACARLVDVAYGHDEASRAAMFDWWSASYLRLVRRTS